MKEVWNMYARELRSCLQCSRAQKNAFLRETKRLAVDYMAGISEPSIEDLIEFLGTPEELARSYQDTLGEQSARIYRKQINQIPETNQPKAVATLYHQSGCTGWRHRLDCLLYVPFRPLA